MSQEKILHQDPKEIAKFIINHTPIGLLDESLKNLKVLLKEETLNSPEVLQELKKYKENHLIPISVPNLKEKVLISPYNQDNEDFYYDQIQKTRFKLNVNCEPENIEEYEITTDIFRKAWRKMEEYITKYYNKNAVYYNVFHYDLWNKINIIISGKIIDNRNSWTGEWISTWELDITTKKIEGKIAVNTMYYEEGNIQFNFKKNFEGNIKGNDQSSLVDELIEFIENNENEVQNTIEKLNENLSEEYVKPLRKRVSLIEREMNWSLDQIQFKQS